jgi:hypothetical protein
MAKTKKKLTFILTDASENAFQKRIGYHVAKRLLFASLLSASVTTILGLSIKCGILFFANWAFLFHLNNLLFYSISATII